MQSIRPASKSSLENDAKVGIRMSELEPGVSLEAALHQDELGELALTRATCGAHATGSEAQPLARSAPTSFAMRDSNTNDYARPELRSAGMKESIATRKAYQRAIATCAKCLHAIQAGEPVFTENRGLLCQRCELVEIQLKLYAATCKNGECD